MKNCAPLTGSANSERKGEVVQLKHETNDTDKCKGNSIVVSLMEVHRGEKGESRSQASGRKRSSGSTTSDGNYIEQSYA
ncbi:unnamed protein product [Ilex paraguariensis]|uniref:Uncharacterized protein n=1 Tax=Ilex paraguariensis TaxID=185542 RepID=A0ABC8USJ3_9AQUA